MAEQQQQQHPNKLAFEEGVTYIFKAWTALKLAVEQEWGGVESAEKRDWMIETIVDYFGKRMSTVYAYIHFVESNGYIPLL